MGFVLREVFGFEVFELGVCGTIHACEGFADAANTDVVDDDVPGGEGEAEFLFVLADEGVTEGPVVAIEVLFGFFSVGTDYHESRLGTAIPHIEVLFIFDGVVGEALILKSFARAFFQIIHLRLQAISGAALGVPDL